MPTTRHEIELALNSAAYRRISQAQETAMGTTFWARSFKRANKELKNHIKLTTDLGDDLAESLSNQFDNAFKNSAGLFGEEVEKAVKEGSNEYVKCMTRAVDRIAKLQEKTDEDRAEAVQKIIDIELKGLQEKIKLGRESSKTKKNMGEEHLGKRAQKFKDWTTGAKSTLTKHGTSLGGSLGKTVSGVGEAVGGLSKYAGAAGAVLGVAAAIGVLAHKALEVQREMKKLNTTMTQSMSATDLMGAGYLSVEEGMRSLRKEFMENISVNYKWRMTTEEAYEAMNALVSTGVSLGKLNRQLGRDVKGVGQTARDVVDITKTYSTQFKLGVGEIGSFMGDLMLNLNYSFSQTSSALASISNQSQKAGIGAGVFFGKVQSLNSQLGLMNSSLQVQAKVLADLVLKGPLGLEQASQAAGNIMGKLDEQSGRNLLAFVGEAKGMALARAELERVQKKLANPDIDATLRRRMEAERSQIQRALAGGMIEVMKLFEGGLTSETSNLEARFAAVAKVLGKSVDNLNYQDLINVSFDNTEMLKQLGVMGGSTEEVNKNLMAMAGIIDANGGVREALVSMDTESMAPLKEKISEDIRLAQEMLRETEDISKILINIKEWMMSQMYDILVKMYEVLVSAFGDKKSKAVVAYDKAIRRNKNEQLTTTGPDLLELQSQEKGLMTERSTIENLDESGFDKFLQNYGGGNLEATLAARIGNKTTSGMGALTGGGGEAITPKTRMAPTKEVIQAAEKPIETAYKSSLGTIASEVARKTLESKDIVVGDVYKTPEYKAWEANTMNKKWESAAPATKVFAYEDTQGAMADVNKVKKNTIYKYLNALENPENSLITRPTPSLLEENSTNKTGGNTKGDTHFHVHGNVYGMDELQRMVKKSMTGYEKTQRVNK